MQENSSATVVPINIMVVDDHALFRDGVKLMFAKLKHLGFNIVNEASNGVEAIRILEEEQPDVILMDVQMPELNGIGATNLISKKYPHIPIIALSSSDDLFYIEDMIKAGAKGYTLKNTNKEEMVAAIEAVCAGGTFYSPLIASKLEASAHERQATLHIPPLTEREKEVVVLLCQGKSNKEIAKALFISKRTVEGHRSNITLKLRLHHPTDIMAYALKHGMYKL
ncbi:MAG: putative two-component Response regulator [Flaviaesturariibacter sp.]|nr:putative two-component Response regulator [Flaviaesturariibacter sp.]